jgi:apolipoprotein N-acyltransferase
VIGCTRATEGPTGIRKYNSAAFVDCNLGLRGYYDKVFLVPQWEFSPRTFFFSETHGGFERGSGCPIFQLKSRQPAGTFAFSSSICYDIAFPQLYRQCMRAESRAPDFFAVCSSERADRTGRLARDLFNLARFRAIECRRAVVRNVDCGYSGIISSTGVLQHAELDWRIGKPTPVGHIPIDSRRTLFVRWGDWMSAVALSLVLTGAALRLVRSVGSSAVCHRRGGY